jgi:PAS domain S-box-containing protein
VPTATIPRRYVVAILTVAAAIVVRSLLQGWLGYSVPYLQFFPAIMVAAWYGGYGPGLAATALSAVVAFFWFLLPAHAVGLAAVADALSLSLFVVIGILISRLNENLHRSRAAQRDATDRLQAQYDALVKADIAQGQLAALVASSNDAIVSKTLDGVITSWNAAAERLFGYTPAEAIGQPILLIIPPDHLDEERQVIAKIRAGERVDTFETVRCRKDGTLVDVAITVSPIRNRSGTIVAASKIVRDISEFRRNERQREELLARERSALEDATAARDRLQFLAEVSALLTSSLDYEATLDRAVHLALPRLGDFCNVLVQNEHGRLRHSAWAHVVREKEPLVRELIAALFEGPAEKQTPTYASRVMTSGKTVVAPHDALVAAVDRLSPVDPRMREIGEQLRPYAYVGAPLLVRGRPIGVMSCVRSAHESARDYTEPEIALIEDFARRVSLAIENARLFREADELNRLKDEFLATVSHELRTPLSAILGWSRLLSTGQLDAEKARRAVEIIERNTHAQTRLVDDILDVARGMAGNVHLETKPLDLTAVAQRGIDSVAPAAAAKQIHIDVHAAPRVCVIGDASRLQQVIWNLLSNAVKFTPSGGEVTVSVTALDGSAQLEVSDTGAGIPAEFLPYVFDKFRQADASFTRQYGGLGLGLAITRHLVELHGGTIEARSGGKGQGATFCVRLPVAPVDVQDSTA